MLAAQTDAPLSVEEIRDSLAREIAWHVVHGRKVPDELLAEYRQAKRVLRARADRLARL